MVIKMLDKNVEKDILTINKKLSKTNPQYIIICFNPQTRKYIYQLFYKCNEWRIVERLWESFEVNDKFQEFLFDNVDGICIIPDERFRRFFSMEQQSRIFVV